MRMGRRRENRWVSIRSVIRELFNSSHGINLQIVAENPCRRTIARENPRGELGGNETKEPSIPDSDALRREKVIN